MTERVAFALSMTLLCACWSARAEDKTRFTLLDRDQSEHNRAFSEAARGSELAIEGESARVSKDTRVEPSGR